MKQILFLSFLGLMLVACESETLKKQEQEVSEMITDVNSLKSNLFVNKIDSVVELRLMASSLMIRIKSNYTFDKIDMKLGRKVDEFRELQMLFEKEKEEGKQTLPGQYSTINKMIQEEEKALKLLKSDIENKRGEQEKYNEYIQYEQRKVAMISEMFNHYLSRKTKSIPRFYKEYNDLDSIVSEWEKQSVKK